MHMFNDAAYLEDCKNNLVYSKPPCSVISCLVLNDHFAYSLGGGGRRGKVELQH